MTEPGELPFEAINGVAPTAAPAVSDDELPFEAINGGAPAPPDADMRSLVASPAIGFNRGVADVLGFPVDATNWTMSKLGLPTSSTPFGGSESIKKGMGLIGANPDTAQHTPRSQLEKILQSSGEGAAAMVAPEAIIGGMAASGLKMAPRVAEAADTLFGSGQTPAKNAIIGASAAGTGEAAAQHFPDSPGWAMTARMAGNLVGGGAGMAATEAPAVVGAVKNFVAPMREAGQKQLAGQTLSDALTNRAGTMEALDNAPREIVPGSTPTTFQLTGDMGLGSLERQQATQNPAAFNDLRAAQNQARVDALGGIQQAGSPEDVSAHLRSRLDELDQQAGAIQSTAAQRAQTASGALGGNQSPGFYGDAIHGEVAPQLQAATNAAAGQVSALGGVGTSEGFGEALRTPYQQATEALRQQRNSLYKAIDPDNSLNIVASPLRDASDDLYASTSKMATPPSGEEAGIRSTINQMPDVVPFNDLRALDSRITAAMSAERRAAGETPVWGRLTQLKSAVSDAIDNGVANQVAYERDAVARGDIQPTDTLEARLAAERDNFLNQRAAVGDSGAGNGAGASGGSPGAAGSNGAIGQAGRRSGADAGAPGLPPEELSPNFDPAAADRLTAAKQANVALQANKKGPLGPIIRTDGFGQPKMLASAVPENVFARGPGGFEKAMEYRRAVNDDPAAINAMQNYAAASLRKAAERPADGTLDSARFLTWRAAHADAMRAFPELARRFNTAANASASLQRFAPFRADMAPSQIPEMFFHSGPSGGEGVANLRRLVGNAKADSILSDYAAAKLKAAATNPADGTLDPGKVAAFQKAHAEALKALPGLSDKFSTAAKAQQTVDAVAKARKQGLDVYQAGAIGKVMNAAPEDVTKHIGSIFGSKDSAAQMDRLAREAASDKTGAAMAGLRKGVADFINSRFISNTEAGTSGANLVKSDAFQTFMNQSRPALAKVFKPDEIASMDAIAADLHRANRSVTAIRLPGQSNTAQDLTVVSKGTRGEQKPLLREIAEGAVAGHVAHGPVGAVAGASLALGKHVAGAMRAAGYSKIDDLVRDALLNPDLAKALLMKATTRADRGSDIALTQQLRRLSAFTAAQQVAPPQFRGQNR
jgi:hypothetical protein